MRVLAVLIACAILIPTATWGLEPDDPALVGVWLFDEGSGDTIGDLINGNDATINLIDVEFEWQEGKFGGAVADLDGAGSIQVGNSPVLSRSPKKLRWPGGSELMKTPIREFEIKTAFCLRINLTPSQCPMAGRSACGRTMASSVPASMDRPN